MNKDPQLAIVIINWNKAQEVLHCVYTISSWTELKAEIIIIDNGSSPEEASLLLNSKGKTKNSKLQLKAKNF